MCLAGDLSSSLIRRVKNHPRRCMDELNDDTNDDDDVDNYSDIVYDVAYGDMKKEAV
jgi:hypothetical protein